MDVKLSGNITLTGALFFMPIPMLEVSHELECALISHK